ncbi:hypothetical protein Q1695_013599 [Nippostrongylus brasiliensis]|nr:hypothetical protein Q1695_013599 [Nippostrongylus brasiliensis]
MKGGGIGRPPPDAGIPSDMKTLYEAFRERKSFRLLEFYKVAENYGLKSIFAGRMSVAELVGFEENLLKAAFAYIRPRKEYPNGIGEERSLLERIFGVYVTFVIFYAQPLDYVTKIHITPVDRCDLMFFLWNVLIPGYHVDACSCIQRLFVDDAFRTVVSVKNHDLTNHKRYEKPNIVDVLVDEKERYNPIEITKEVMENPAMKAFFYVESKLRIYDRHLNDTRFGRSGAAGENIKRRVHTLHKIKKSRWGSLIGNVPQAVNIIKTFVSEISHIFHLYQETRLEKRDVIYVFKTHDSRLYSTLAYEIDKLDDALDEDLFEKVNSSKAGSPIENTALTDHVEGREAGTYTTVKQAKKRGKQSESMSTEQSSLNKAISDVLDTSTNLTYTGVNQQTAERTLTERKRHVTKKKNMTCSREQHILESTSKSTKHSEKIPGAAMEPKRLSRQTTKKIAASNNTEFHGSSLDAVSLQSSQKIDKVKFNEINAIQQDHDNLTNGTTGRSAGRRRKRRSMQ